MKAFLLCSLILFIAAVSAKIPSSDQKALRQFIDFQHKYNKVYTNDAEFHRRFRIFKDNVAKAAEYQARETGSATYGVTKFSDLSEQEFRAMYLMPTFSAKDMPKGPISQPKSNEMPTANGFDWNTKGAITPVYNQEQCGSCWAFSATETIESYWFLAGNTLTELSVQQIVDCDTNGEDQGCNGGWPYGAYEYIIGAGGQDTLQSYQYTGEDGTCQFSQSNIGAHISNWTYVTQSQDENVMLKWISSTGPLSICVDASSWSYYTGGVIQNCTQNLDHCVQLTGFSTQQGIQAWNVRNSWGTDWGVNGYIYLQRGQDMCGMAQVVTAVSV